MSELIVVAVLSSLVSLIGSASLFFIAVRKLKPEMAGMEAGAHESDATAAESALKSTALASEQLMAMQIELYSERKRRVELESKVDDMGNQIEKLSGRIKRLEAQVISMDKEPVK